MIHLTIFIPRKKHFFRLFLLLNVNDICRYFGNPKFRFLNIASLNKANRIIVKYIVRFSLTRHRFFYTFRVCFSMDYRGEKTAFL